MYPIKTAQVKYDTFPLKGGLDTVSPTTSLPPGAAREALNFEVSVHEGYTRVEGYERYDGQVSPNAAVYSGITMDAIALPALGETIAAGAVTAKVISVRGLDIFFTAATGTFLPTDIVTIGGVPVGTVVDTAPPLGSALDAEMKILAADVYRAAIGEVPGSGPIRGLAWLSDWLYAWRDNAGGTAMVVHKATGAGWVSVSLGHELPFNTGASTAIVEGNVISNLAGTAGGVVSRVCLETGSTWIGGSGRLVLSSVTGTWAASDQIRVGGVQRATATATSAPIVLAPGGRVETVTASLGGNLTAPKLYGADCVNRAFEFDGTVYAPIRITGLTQAQDKPRHVCVHKNFLFLSIGNSVQNSALAAPFVWNAVLGANEIALYETVTGLQSMPSSETAALLISTRNNTSILYGNTPASLSLTSFDRSTGAAEWTLQNLSDAYMLDDRGAVQLKTSQAFGNFDTGTLTYQIKKFIEDHCGLATASGVHRGKSQYRIFYSDGYGLYLTIVNGRMKGAMPVLFPKPVNVWCEADASDGSSKSFFGSGSDGFVYQMDTGPDFDGEAVAAFLTLNFNPQNASRVLKRYRRASFEITGSAYAGMDIGFLFGYDTIDIEQPDPVGYSSPLRGAVWDSFTWDAFIWDEKGLAPIEVDCNGTAENIALTVSTATRHTTSFTINTVTLHYSVRRGIR